MKPARPEMLIRSGLLKRGWTGGMVDRFLTLPDKLVTNPRYSSNPKMALYLLERVEMVEASDEFKAAMAQAAPRKEGARKAVETKAEKTRICAQETVADIRVPSIPKDRLIARACRSYNERLRDRGQDEGPPATKDSNPPFLHRIAVNYLRHEMTGYDSGLARTYGKVAARNAYKIIKGEILAAIAAQYPWLAEECERQRNAVEVQTRLRVIEFGHPGS